MFTVRKPPGRLDMGNAMAALRDAGTLVLAIGILLLATFDPRSWD